MSDAEQATGDERPDGRDRDRGGVAPDDDVGAIYGIGDASAPRLADAGYPTVAELADARPGDVVAIDGIAPSRAARFIGAARAIVDGDATATASGAADDVAALTHGGDGGDDER